MSKHKFHVGQPVRLKDTVLGDVVAKIISIEILDVITVSIKNNNHLYYVSSDDIDPAYHLEVGCKVRVVDGGSTYNGMEGEVNSWNGQNIVCFKSGNMLYHMGSDYLIVIEPAPKNDFKVNETVYFGHSPDTVVMGTLTCDYKDLVTKSIHTFVNGGNEMETKSNFKKLAERMKDELVGNGKGTIFLKKTGECSIERREIEFDITPEEIEALLKVRGITKALGTFEIETYREHYNIGIIKFIPLSKKNESD